MPKKSAPAEPDYKELYQRSLADVENMRKRMQQEKEQISRFALAQSVSSLLPIVDNFYRAIEHVPEDQKESPWLTGILYIQKQLTDVLSEWGVEEIPAKPGDVFNPDLHEALDTEVAEGLEDDRIVRVQNRGYQLHGRVVRPATVITSKN